MVWCDHCSLGKSNREPERGRVGIVSGPCSPSWSPLPKHLPVWKSWSNLCQTDAPEEPSFLYRSLLPITEAPHLFHLCHQSAITSIPTAGQAALLLLIQTWGIPQDCKPLTTLALGLTEGGQDAPCCFKSCLSSQLQLMSS